MKKLLSLAVSLLAVAVFLTSPGAHAAAVTDCTANSIIKCGALTQADLKAAYDKNATGDLPAIFSKYGITADDINGELQMGRVTKQGTVEVNGKVVATSSHSLGRSPINGSHPITISGKTYYETPDTMSLARDYLDAFVIMKNGQFVAAIMAACGNPVNATPVKPPVTPAYACTSLTATPTDRTTFRFTADATASNGATIDKYGFGFGDGMGVTVPDNTYTYSYKQAGTYTASVTAYVTVNGQTVEAKGSQCTVKVTVKEEQKPEMCQVAGKENLPKDSPDCKEMCQVPGKENLPKDSPDCVEQVSAIPSTGPADLAGAGMGAGSLTAAGYYFVRSRRNLLKELLKK